MASRRSVFLLVVVAAATVAAYVTMFVLDTTKDRPDTLDVEPVRGAAASACARLRSDLVALPALPPVASAEQRRERLRVQDEAVRALVDRVRAVGEDALRRDLPAQEWLADWTALADARRAYAEAGATGPFTVPVADGRPIAERMGRVGLESCTVPAALTSAP